MGRRVGPLGPQGCTESVGHAQCERSYEFRRCDGCLFRRSELRREHVEEKAGRHIDDFLVTGPEPEAGTRQI